MIFAWYGFSIEHPEDWAPVALTGNRQEGYVRIASPGRQSLQIRWKASRPGVSLASVIASYLDRLERDAKASKVPFTSHIEEESERLTYRYSAGSCGRGSLQQSQYSGRVFFLEAVSSKSDSLLPTFRRLLESFREEPDKDRWALFGLNVVLPTGLDLDRKVLESGRTVLSLSNRKARVEIQRWGFAAQLIAKHGLEPWARAMLSLANAASEASDKGVEFRFASKFARRATHAIVQVQPDRNQIATIKVETREDIWRPQWEWLA